jgi:hypothetical protein
MLTFTPARMAVIRGGAVSLLLVLLLSIGTGGLLI